MRCCYCGQYNTIASLEGDFGVRVGECQVCGEGYHRRLNRAKRIEYEISQLHPFEPYLVYSLPSDDTVDDYYIKTRHPNGCAGVHHKMYHTTYAEAKAKAIELSKQYPDMWGFVEAHYTPLEYWKDGQKVRTRFFVGTYQYKGQTRRTVYIVPDGMVIRPICDEVLQEYDPEVLNRESIQRQRETWEHNHAISVKRIQEEWA